MAADESRLPRELGLSLAHSDGGPLRRRLADACRQAIRDGRLRGGDRLPSTRALADQLGVSRGVASDAYRELAAGGYIELRDRAAPRVRDAAVSPDSSVRRSVPPPRYSFNLLTGDLSIFPRGIWSRCTADVLRTMADAEFDYVDAAGHPRLRAELSEYLRRGRGLAADASRVLVTQGNTQALQIICRVLALRGARRIAIENPSFDSAWTAAAAAGLEPVPLDVDALGANPDALGRLDPDAVFLTPAHQFPLGPVLSSERRTGFLRWARERARYVIEDDYDAEFRYDRDAIPSLQGTAPERVLYVGTASKMLAPGLRLGWTVVPQHLVAECRDAKLYSDAGSPTIDQLVFAEFLRRGHLDRHLQRLRLASRARRDALVELLNAKLPEARITGQRSGSHVTAILPALDSEAKLRRQAARSGIALRTLDEFAFAPHAHGHGVVLGYPQLRLPELARAVGLLADVVRAAYPTSTGSDGSLVHSASDPS